jgi:predicted RNase H-like HicB family nuclease
LCYNNAMKRKVVAYNVIFQPEIEGGFSVWVPSLPGCASQGETFEEAKKNIKEAITLYLEDEKEIEEDTKDQFMVPVTITQS